MKKQKTKRKAIIPPEACVACGSCQKVCPRGAIAIVQGVYAEVDDERCIGCGICVKECPASIIAIAAKETVKERMRA